VATISIDKGNLNHKWRCRSCGQLLGVTDGERLEIRYRRRLHYLVLLPAACVCPDPRCNAFNELSEARPSCVTAQGAAAQL